MKSLKPTYKIESLKSPSHNTPYKHGKNISLFENNFHLYLMGNILERDTAPQKLAFVNLDCIMASFGWQLHYMLTKISLKFEG